AFLANHVNGAHRRGVRHIRLFEAKTLWEQVLNGHGSPALWALEIDGGHGTKFVDHLAASAARRARHILFANYCNFSDFHSRAQLSDGRKNGSALGAIGHSVRGVFDVTAGEYLSACRPQGGSNSKVRVGS